MVDSCKPTIVLAVLTEKVARGLHIKMVQSHTDELTNVHLVQAALPQHRNGEKAGGKKILPQFKHIMFLFHGRLVKAI